MKLARRFKEEYSRYERLYKEAQTMTDMSRKKDTIDQVLVMHRNLEKLKNKIAYISPV
jgi:RNA polymerase II elongation factor ELL